MGEKHANDLKYGFVGGSKTSVPVAMAASQSSSIGGKGGKFVYLNSGKATICVDGSTGIFGWIEASKDVTYADGDVVNCIIDTNARFVIPITGGTFTEAMKGTTCDLEVASGLQGAQLDASAEDTVFIVDGDLINNEWVEVMINPIKQRATGVV